jgi:malate synthase
MTEYTTRLQVHGPSVSGASEILTPEALAFVEGLVREFGPRVDELLARRSAAQVRHDAGDKPDFLPATAAVRAGDWQVKPLPIDLQRRTVEITGPVDRKMIINALNSGADVFMADFEDSSSPTWQNLIGGQANLRDAVRGTIEYRDPGTGKHYALGERVATLMVRPRGWHLKEKHVTWRGVALPAALVDFGLYFFHNARALMARGTGPYFYLPKLQSHLEARLWNQVFEHAQSALDLPPCTIRATVLIETLPAVFEMDEILHELRDHAAGLNCGRWDYIFSYIKTFRNHAAFVLPDRGQVGMTQPFMRAYTQLLIKTCHRRGAMAMGGMAAQIPIKNDPEANEAALARVRADKEREARDGHDGTWVAHPGLVPVAREAFEAVMTGPTQPEHPLANQLANQLHRLREDVSVSAADLIAVPEGTRTDAGLRQNILVGVQYLEAWLRGVGCVPLYNLMEDAATAEISRTQIWQWLRHGVTTDDGRQVTVERVHATMAEELERVRSEIGAERFERGAFSQACELFTRLATDTSQFIEFLTLPAYDLLVQRTSAV